MKKLIVAIVLIVPAVALGFEDPVRVYTVPRGPAREVLDRLSLTQAWRTRIPLESRRDGIFSFQILRDKASPQIAIQTFSGTVILLDGETGDLLWRTTISQAYWTAQPVAYNSKNIFTTRRNDLHVLNRATGQERLYSLDKDSKLPIYGMRLLSAPSSAPAADEETIVFCFGNQITAYVIPIFEEDEKARQAEVKGDAPLRRPSLQPELMWNHLAASTVVHQVPLLGDGQVGVIGTDGSFLALNRLSYALQYTYKVHGLVAAAMGQHNHHAYIGSEDSTVYALNVRTGQLMWRHFSGGPIVRKPEVTDRDVFVVAERKGLYRVDRQTGMDLWLNRSADKFLGTNQRFVYALDRQGTMLILDYERGTTLANYEMRDWTVHANNEWTDRVYLASHDGQVLCLHHRDQRKPMSLKTIEVPVAKDEGKKDEKKEEKKEMKEPDPEKEKDKDKDKEKDKDAGKEKVGMRSIDGCHAHGSAWAWVGSPHQPAWPRKAVAMAPLSPWHEAAAYRRRTLLV